MAMQPLNELVELMTSLRTCLTFLFIMSLPTRASLAKEIGENYGILLDAGSSSSKLNIYRLHPSPKTLVPQIDVIANFKFETALSTFEKNTQGIRSYVEGILSKAKESVPAGKYAQTPIFLMATAGLRFFSASDVKTLLESIKSVMADQAINPFWYNPSNVRVLSGEKEGAYSWIAANYLLGFFHRNRPESESVGVLEMGGGSTQITFIPNSPLYSEEYQVTVAGRTFQLYVQSYLQYGANAIKLRVADSLAKLYPGKEEVDNPCMLRGDTARTSRLDDGRVLTERGVGAPEVCLKLLHDILKPHSGIHCHPKPCAIGSVYQPSVDSIRFYATQAYTYAPHALGVVGEDQVLHIDKLEEAASRHCNRSLERAMNESHMAETYASNNCLMGLYIPTLLTVSYGFSRNTTSIRLASSLGKEKIDWSLGAMLVELSNLFCPEKSRFSIICNRTEAEFMGAVNIRGSNLAQSVQSWTYRLIFVILSLLIAWEIV